ncbi:MAG: YceI family protein [Gemmatimonadetes bacterium]|nr:YceI family protein [Gemmatimonadota bacterium]
MSSSAQDAVVTTGAVLWQLDGAHTTVEFAVKHLMIAKVKGRFTAVTGSLKLDEADPAGSLVEARMDAASIDTGQEQRDEHLRSADFLDAGQYPAILFRSRRIDPRAEGRYELVGDLTIRDVAREVVLEVEETGRVQDPWGKERVGFSARGKIDRRDFGLTWNQVLEAGGLAVGNEVSLSIEVELVRQSAQQAA